MSRFHTFVFLGILFSVSLTTSYAADLPICSDNITIGKSLLESSTLNSFFDPSITNDLSKASTDTEKNALIAKQNDYTANAVKSVSTCIADKLKDPKTTAEEKTKLIDYQQTLSAASPNDIINLKSASTATTEAKQALEDIVPGVSTKLNPDPFYASKVYNFVENPKTPAEIQNNKNILEWNKGLTAEEAIKLKKDNKLKDLLTTKVAEEKILQDIEKSKQFLSKYNEQTNYTVNVGLIPGFSGDIYSFANKVIRSSVSIAMTLAVFVLVLAGFAAVQAKDSAKEEYFKKVTNVAIGIAVILFSYLIVAGLYSLFYSL